jgi:hypothetical protein
MKINIQKQVCDRCTQKEIIKDTDGVTLSFRGIDVLMCNECAIELANLIFLAVHNNQKEGNQ